MKGGPPLWGIAQAAFAETDKSYTETCEILDIDPNTQHKALFVSEEPPINPVQAQSHEEMHEFDSHITDLHAENE